MPKDILHNFMHGNRTQANQHFVGRGEFTRAPSRFDCLNVPPLPFAASSRTLRGADEQVFLYHHGD